MADKKTKQRTQRGMRDEAGVGPNPHDARRLVPLKDLDDYQVAEGEPDIRGWNVYTATGRELGDIHDLLVDPDMGEVVMMDVDLKRDDRHTLAPIKAAWIDRGNHRVVLNTSMFDADDDIPALHRPNEPVETESVRRFNERYARAYGEDGWDRDRDITIRRGTEDFTISRATPPADHPVDRAATRAADTVERAGDRVADATERSADNAAAAARAEPQPERRRFVRYGPSRDGVTIEEVVVRRRVVDPADLSPSETERLRQESGDVTRDARETLVNPAGNPPVTPPTEERR